MNPHKSEQVRIYLAKSIFSPAAGFSFGDWVRLLRQQRFRIAPGFLPRAFFLTLSSIPNSIFRRREEQRYAHQLDEVEIQPPLFIVGHWRSGTTHLHNLLSLDTRFAYPNFIQATQPHTFLTNEEKLKKSKLLKLLSPKTRLIDNMSASADAPMEDEVALCILTGLSPLMGSIFPRSIDHYQRYLTLRDVSDEELKRWKQGLTLFIKKLTLKYNRPVILKSPPHTCRLKIILDVFPQARFIHIHRNPYQVYLSYIRSVRILNELLQVQQPSYGDLEQRTIDQYRQMYDVFFAERELIPDGQFCDISYEQLVLDPMHEIRTIYEKLELSGFSTVEPDLKRYLDSIAGYQMSKLPALNPELRNKISSTWKQSFEEWGYQT